MSLVRLPEDVVVRLADGAARTLHLVDDAATRRTADAAELLGRLRELIPLPRIDEH